MINKKERRDLIVALVILSILILAMNYLVKSVSWGNIWYWTWRGMVASAFTALPVWILVDDDRRKTAGKTLGHKWFKWFAVITVLFFIIFYGLKPWVEGMVKESQMARVAEYRARVEEASKHADIEQEQVATEAKPVLVIPRSKVALVSWAPVGYVSYKVTYPTSSGDTTVTFLKTEGHKKLPFPLKWMSFRPVDADSVVLVIRQHDP